MRVDVAGEFGGDEAFAGGALEASGEEGGVDCEVVSVGTIDE